jgi:uncharacterized protein YjeT (DUF2065 family)
MNMRLRQMLSLYQYVAGICDAGAGLLLVGFPDFTFRLMGLSTIPPRAFIRFIGVFVLSVGITYLWTVIRWPLNEHSAVVWLTQWKITAFIRMCVAVFVIWQISAHSIEFGWISVALTDGIFAAAQLIGLEQGWIERAI